MRSTVTRSRLIALGVAIALALPAGATLGSGAPALAAVSAPGFGAPVEVPGASGTEPTLAISDTGQRYMAWQVPGAVSSTLNGKDFAKA
ncbi:MAG: hypothetical protein QOC87_522, partial [Actinomycetota bacterium]|nr:hypothetical protein [Actinomycetota bacterium]